MNGDSGAWKEWDNEAKNPLYLTILLTKSKAFRAQNAPKIFNLAPKIGF